MVQRRIATALVTYSKLVYYMFKNMLLGTSYEAGRAFETYTNQKFPQKTKNLRVHVVFVPVPRSQLFSRLTDGAADIAIAGLTSTPERQKIVDFSDSTATGINEIAVTGPESPALASIDDLAGKEVFLRKSSSYWEHVERLNEPWKKEKRAAMKLRAVPEDLEDEDLLEMVNASLLSTIIVDDYAVQL